MNEKACKYAPNDVTMTLTDTAGGGEEDEGVGVVEGVEGMILSIGGDTSTDGGKSLRGKKNKSSPSSSSSSSSSSGPLPLPTLCTVVKGHLLKERHNPNVAPMLVAFLSIVKVASTTPNQHTLSLHLPLIQPVVRPYH